MDANGRELILRDEVYAIIACSLEIINFKKSKLEWERIVLSSNLS